MARVKLRCIIGCPGLKNSYREKGLLKGSMFVGVWKWESGIKDGPIPSPTVL